jgi:DNA (cytosine-5)-methyltransferase 1
MKIGSLCTGYGGLDMAVEAYFEAETVWCAEIDKYASQLLKQHFDYPNYGDIKTIDWAQVEPIDIMTAGYPCQPFSSAGYRKGTDDKRHIFPFILEAISALRPRFVILENVRGHLSLGLKEVLIGLASIGYDARWKIVRASDVGAPHQRARLFIIAYPVGFRCQDKLCGKKSDQFIDGVIADSYCYACEKSRRTNRGISKSGNGLRDGQDQGKTQYEHRGGGEAVTDPDYTGRFGSMQRFQSRFNSRREMSMQTAPNTLDQLGRLNPPFVEYMMGLPKGWVTDLDISRSQQLKMLGNGVVPQQAYYAIQQLMELDTPSEQDLS